MKKLSIFVLLLSVFFVGCSSEPEIVPKAGYYEGEDVSFTLTEDGKLTDIQLKEGFLGETYLVKCETMHFPEDDLTEYNNFWSNSIYTEGDEDIKSFITGKFLSDTTVEGDYFLKWCITGESVSYEMQPYDGMHNKDWAAEWISE